MSCRRSKASSPSADCVWAWSPCGGLLLFIHPCFVTLHAGRADQVSFNWAVCGAVLSLWGAGPPALRFVVGLQLPLREGPDVAGTSSQEACAVSPQQRSLAVLSDLPAGIYRAELKPVTSESAWAFPHLTAACLVVCLLHHAIYIWMFLNTSMPTLIARCHIIFPFWLLTSCIYLDVLAKSFTIPRRR